MRQPENGHVYPPRDEHDVLAYDALDMMAGYRECQIGDPFPRANHAPGFRWGWATRLRDMSLQPDEFDEIRTAVIQAAKADKRRVST